LFTTLPKKLWIINKEANWALIDQSVVSGFNFLFSILLANYLGLKLFGVFSLIWMIVLLLNNIQVAAVIQPLMTLSAKYQKHKDNFYTCILLFHIIFLIFTLALSLLVHYLLMALEVGWYVEMPITLILAVLVLFQTQDLLRRYYFAEAQQVNSFISDIITYGGRILILMAVNYLYGLDIETTLLIISSSSLLGCFIALKHHPIISLNKNVTYHISRDILNVSKWLVPSSLVQWFSGQIYFLVAGILLGPVSVGALKAGQSVIGVTNILFQAMENFAAKGASIAYQYEGYASLNNYLKRISIYGGSITVAVCVALIISSDQIYSLIFREEYHEYSWIISWLGVTSIFIFFSFPLSIGLRTLNKSSLIFKFNLILGLLSASAVYPLVLNYGVIGVLIGLLFSRVLLCLLMYPNFNE
jgi:O-antigen/teichoic acid export membrane protein